MANSLPIRLNQQARERRKYRQMTEFSQRIYRGGEANPEERKAVLIDNSRNHYTIYDREVYA